MVHIPSCTLFRTVIQKKNRKTKSLFFFAHNSEFLKIYKRTEGEKKREKQSVHTELII